MKWSVIWFQKQWGKVSETRWQEVNNVWLCPQCTMGGLKIQKISCLGGKKSEIPLGGASLNSELYMSCIRGWKLRDHSS